MLTKRIWLQHFWFWGPKWRSLKSAALFGRTPRTCLRVLFHQEPVCWSLRRHHTLLPVLCWKGVNARYTRRNGLTWYTTHPTSTHALAADRVKSVRSTARSTTTDVHSKRIPADLWTGGGQKVNTPWPRFSSMPFTKRIICTAFAFILALARSPSRSDWVAVMITNTKLLLYNGQRRRLIAIADGKSQLSNG